MILDSINVTSTRDVEHLAPCVRLTKFRDEGSLLAGEVVDKTYQLVVSLQLS